MGEQGNDDERLAASTEPLNLSLELIILTGLSLFGAANRFLMTLLSRLMPNLSADWND